MFSCYSLKSLNTKEYKQNIPPLSEVIEKSLKYWKYIEKNHKNNYKKSALLHRHALHR